MNELSKTLPQTSSENPLEGFLEEQESEGVLHSEGVFTIDIKVAQRKLSTFQFRTPETWILVLVQAANQGRAKKISVTQFPRQTVVVVSGARQWSWKELQPLLENGSTTDGALLGWAVVVRALTGNTQLSSFKITAPDGSQGLWKNGAMVRQKAGVEHLLQTGETVVEVDHIGEHENGSWFFESRRNARKALVAINNALVRSCFASAVPLWCDGRRISGIDLGTPSTSSRYAQPLAVLALQATEIPSTDFSALLKDGSLSLSLDLETRGHEDYSTSNVAAVAIINLALEKEKIYLATSPGRGKSRLLWIDDGVVVQESDLKTKGCLGVTVVASATGLKTDLSGFELVKDQSFEDRQTAIAGVLYSSLVKFREETLGKGFKLPVQSLSRGRLALIVATFAGGVVFPASLLLTLPTAAIAAYGVNRQRELHSWDSAIDEELKALPEQVRNGLQRLSAQAG